VAVAVGLFAAFVEMAVAAAGAFVATSRAVLGRRLQSPTK
jgi:hypothetical protein